MDAQQITLKQQALRMNTRQSLLLKREQLNEQFKQAVPIEQLLLEYSHFIDQLLCDLWLNVVLVPTHSTTLSLFAAGGYARNELLPGSDIDLLVLHEETLSEQEINALSEFFALLWDIKLLPSHHIFRLEEELNLTDEHLSTLTTLLEARLLSGETHHLVQLKEKLQQSPQWALASFIEAKLSEQTARHQRYAKTEYSLQPDLKNSPGGLRDIHLLQWIALKQTGNSQLCGLVSLGILTFSEFQQLQHCQHYLWQLRYALHLVSHKKENRLLFEYQAEVATLLKFSGEPHQQVEQMMRCYFSNVKRLIIIKEIALLAWQSFIPHPKTIKSIDCDFQLVNNAIDILNPDYFIHAPAGLVKIFYIMAQLNLPFKTTLTTLRQLDQAIQNHSGYLIDVPEACQYFLAILNTPHAIKQVVLAMQHYDFFNIYTPAWQQIRGLMQFNFFHSYPVDEHTIQTLYSIEQLAIFQPNSTCPLFEKIYRSLDKPHLLFLAALLHDSGKGLNGQHAIIGQKIAAEFTQKHQLSLEQSQLICWLVEQHLLFSHTAQRLNIQDPIVIEQFMQQVGTLERLNYLYCLTVADICATHPTLWNDWRNSVLSELYYATLNRFNHYAAPQTPKQCQQQILNKVNLSPLQQQRLQDIWRNTPSDYFLRHPIQQLAWHTTALLAALPSVPQILIRHSTQRGATEIFIYTKDKPSLFAIICDCLHRKNLSIVSAQIFTSAQNMALDTFVVLQPDGKIVIQDRYTEIQEALFFALQQASYHFSKLPKISLVSYFNIKTVAKFTPVTQQQRTLLSLTTYDRAGLLAQLAQLFSHLHINLHDARIATVGKQVNDFFLLSYQNRHLSSEQQQQILHWIKQELV